MLGLALHQDTRRTGLSAPGRPEMTYLFSEFVDDSTLFLERAERISHALTIIRAFGDLSGLHVQPAKSQLIFLKPSHHG